MALQDRILLLCKEHTNGNMSEFARRTNVTPAYISKIKNNPDAEPSERFLRDICREFKVNENWLKNGVGEMYSPESDDEEIAKILGSINFRMLSEDMNEVKRAKIEASIIKFFDSMNEEQWEYFIKFMQTFKDIID